MMKGCKGMTRAEVVDNKVGKGEGAQWTGLGYNKVSSDCLGTWHWFMGQVMALKFNGRQEMVKEGEGLGKLNGVAWHFFCYFFVFNLLINQNKNKIKFKFR